MLDECLLQVSPENDQLPCYDALCRLNQCKTDLVDAGFPLRGILRESFPSKPEDPRVLEPPSHAKLFVGPKLYLQLPHLLKAAVEIIKKKKDGKSPDAAVAKVLQSRHAIVDAHYLEAVLAVVHAIPSKHNVYIKKFAIVEIVLDVESSNVSKVDPISDCGAPQISGMNVLGMDVMKLSLKACRFILEWAARRHPDVDLLVREHKEHEEHKDDASSALPAWCCRQLNRPRLDA